MGGVDALRGESSVHARNGKTVRRQRDPRARHYGETQLPGPGQRGTTKLPGLGIRTGLELLPALLVACFRSPENQEIVAQEVDTRTLVVNLQRQRAAMEADTQAGGVGGRAGPGERRDEHPRGQTAGSKPA